MASSSYSASPPGGQTIRKLRVPVAFTYHYHTLRDVSIDATEICLTAFTSRGLSSTGDCISNIHHR
eukprot:5658005-Pleurochrysis_carterae.AAC.4